MLNAETFNQLIFILLFPNFVLIFYFFNKALRIGFISFNLSSLDKGCYLQQLLSRQLKLKEMNPILKALLKICTTKNLFKF